MRHLIKSATGPLYKIGVSARYPNNKHLVKGIRTWYHLHFHISPHTMVNVEGVGHPSEMYFNIGANMLPFTVGNRYVYYGGVNQGTTYYYWHKWGWPYNAIYLELGDTFWTEYMVNVAVPSDAEYDAGISQYIANWSLNGVVRNALGIYPALTDYAVICDIYRLKNENPSAGFGELVESVGVGLGEYSNEWEIQGHDAVYPGETKTYAFAFNTLP
jgi:hypothetical protein